MFRSLGFASMLSGVLLLSASAGQAQEFTVKDGVLTFDKQGFKQEFDKMQRDLRGTRTARSRRANTYCISCYDGSKLNCKAVIGGRVGQGLCGLGGAASCPPPGTNGVTAGACGTTQTN